MSHLVVLRRDHMSVFELRYVVTARHELEGKLRFPPEHLEAALPGVDLKWD